MKKTLLALLISIVSLPLFAQMRINRDKTPQTKAMQINTDTVAAPTTRSNSLRTAQQFIADLANPDLALDIVLSKHVLVQDADDEMYDYLLASLAEIRLNLMSKRIEDIRYVTYQEMPRKEVADIDTEGKNTADMVFLYSGKRQMTALLTQNNKIASFTLVSKGGNRAHFVTY
ncbi:hypothetical protein [Sphingobacterium corticibacter]|nr:hypothetical protein [Sphingobacterium corticibacter]